jgi:hypothetical protein
MSKKILTYDQFIHEMTLYEYSYGSIIDIDEYNDEELTNLFSFAKRVEQELKNNNIVIGENNKNIPIYKLLSKHTD